jgi:hypothetical protein
MTMPLVLVLSWTGLDLTMDIEGFLTKSTKQCQCEYMIYLPKLMNLLCNSTVPLFYLSYDD